jgi:D-alanyl-lipoteichoic acid acyltransferase DltB (MBOAT superfamily)
VQIYCDFSAYTDMAIGIAALLGYRFPHNFNQPYRAATLQDFWRRWHISLSSWLRDYLYVPLGGSRHGLQRLCLALAATMLLGGLWHGANWTFVAWGALHGGVLAAERLWPPKLPHFVGVLLTFHVVTLSWIFFRSPDFATASAYLAGLAAGDWSSTMLTPVALVLIVMGMALHFLPADGTRRIAAKVRTMPAGAVGALTGVAILIVDVMRPEGVAPFIYYQF